MGPLQEAPFNTDPGVGSMDAGKHKGKPDAQVTAQCFLPDVFLNIEARSGADFCFKHKTWLTSYKFND